MRHPLFERLPLLGALFLGLFLPAKAKEVPVGPHVMQTGLEVAAVYLQPIEMGP